MAFHPGRTVKFVGGRTKFIVVAVGLDKSTYTLRRADGKDVRKDGTIAYTHARTWHLV